jgi:hypothetical protein
LTRTFLAGEIQGHQVVQLQSSNFFSFLTIISPFREATLAAAASGNFNQVAQQIVDIFVQVASIESGALPFLAFTTARNLLSPEPSYNDLENGVHFDGSIDFKGVVNGFEQQRPPATSVDTPARCLFLPNIRHLNNHFKI